MSMQPADMPERRSALCGNDHFQCDMCKLIEFIDDAGEENYHYLKPELQRLNRFALKYWPDIAGSIHSPGMEETEVTFADEATREIIYALLRTFKLSNAALATICNITRELSPDELVDTARVKRTRHQLKTESFSAVW